MKSALANLFKTPMAEVLSGFTDWHSHILPGVDDGVRTVGESLDLLSEFEKAGIRSVWFTPHIMEDLPNDTATLKAAFDEVRSAYHGPMMLSLASENMLDFLFERRLAERDLLPLPGRRILVETSLYNPPTDFDGLLGRIRSEGFFPVLAHPERYMYMDESRYSSLHGQGTKFQINIPSILGSYGDEVRQRAEWLLFHGMCDFTGTDIHGIGELTAMSGAYIGKKTADLLIGR